MVAILKGFGDIWDGHLARIKAAKLRIEFKSPGVRPIHSTHYRHVPNARVFEKKELGKITNMGVIDTAQTEWTVPIVFARNASVLRRLPKVECRQRRGHVAHTPIE